MGRRPFDVGDLDADWSTMFDRWYAEARESGEPEPEAVAVATTGADGRPSVRLVLMRGHDRRGLVFYTNRRSRKGLELAANPWAALAFRWPILDRQVRVAGPVEEVDDATSDAYFAGRNRGHQLSAWASEQSRPAADRQELQDRLAEVTARFEGADVPRPPWWGGYRVVPEELEFWQQGEARLHDRFRYSAGPGGAWTIERLHP